MEAMGHDIRRGASRGLLLALVSAGSFGLSGSLARGLFDTGWSPGAVVLLRVGIAAVVVAPLGLRALRGRWSAVRRRLGLVGGYGLLAVAGSQFCYFSAVERMQVGPAILIEYTSPAAVVIWLWLRHGHRPSRATIAGAVLAALGLVLVLDLLGGVSLDAAGVAWALAAMVGGTAYFLINADTSTGLPPLGLAWLGLLTGGVLLAVLGLVGLMPLHGTATRVVLAHRDAPWWLPVVLLGTVTAGLAYATGVAAGRLLGSRLASFVSLFEVVSSVVFAWVLLGELPKAVQLLGGLLVLAGVVVVRLGEESADGAPSEQAVVVASAGPVP
jgi:drug/metabolite transporter (DMT)-like permease